MAENCRRDIPVIHSLLISREQEPRDYLTLGQPFDAIINIEGAEGVSFVATFLEADKDELCEEAALALGASRHSDAFAVLKEAWSKDRVGPRADVFLRAISASGLPPAIDFLLELVQGGLQRESEAAIRALDLYAESEEIQGRVREAVKKRKK